MHAKGPVVPVLGAFVLAALAVLTSSGINSGCGTTRTQVFLPGAQALSYLRSAPESSMTIEVMSLNGRAPDEKATALLLQRAREHCDKPGGITLVVDPAVGTVGSNSRTYSNDELAALASAHRTRSTTGSNIVLHVLYVDGGLTGKPAVAAVTVGPDLVVVFEDRFQGAGFGSATAIEGSLLVHELGHVLGLVNETIPMMTPHDDPQHPPHDVSPACVMFWELELNARSTASLPDDFDALCKQDLHAAGGL